MADGVRENEQAIPSACQGQTLLTEPCPQSRPRRSSFPSLLHSLAHFPDAGNNIRKQGEKQGKSALQGFLDG